MTVLVVLIILALVFGVGAVVKGLLWVLAIAAALVVLAVYVAYRKFKSS
jgi:hypothetical protein